MTITDIVSRMTSDEFLASKLRYMGYLHEDKRREGPENAILVYVQPWPLRRRAEIRG